MGDAALSFLSEISDLPRAEKLEKLNSWLNDNPTNPARSIVAELRDSLQEIQILEQEKEIDKKLITAKTIASIQTEYPVLIDRTISMPHFPSSHQHAVVRQLTFQEDVMSSVERTFMSTRFWKADFKGALKRSCDSESEAVILVVSVLKSVIEGLGLDGVIELSLNRTLAGCECDILLVFKANRLPFAVVEVKKPSFLTKLRRLIWEGRRDHNAVAGQIFDEMSAVQLFGFSRVFGMIATGNQWRMTGLYCDEELVCTRGEADALRLAEIKQNLESSIEVLKFLTQLGNHSGESHQGETPSAFGELKISPEQGRVHFDTSDAVQKERTFWASEIVPSADDSTTDDELIEKVSKSGVPIVALVTLFVISACRGLKEYLNKGNYQPRRIEVGKVMPARILKANEQSFSFGTCRLTELKLDVFNGKLKKIYVIHHLGMGERGNCCLGVSQFGSSSCVIKFYHQSFMNDSEATRECGNWHKVYEHVEGFPKCRTFKAAEGHCLIMPYLQPIPQSERQDLLDQGRIKSALRSFTVAGFIHNDIKWRHFGLWNGEVYLLDLGDVGTTNEQDVDTWVKNAMAKLREEMGVRTTQNLINQRQAGIKRNPDATVSTPGEHDCKRADLGNRTARRL